MPLLSFHRSLAAVALPLLLAAAQALTAQSVSLAQAISLRSDGHLSEAASVLNQLLAADPESVAALTELARVKLAQADQSAAEALLSRALAISPNAPDANVLSGTLLLHQKHYPEAMDRFETTLAIAPQEASARAGELQAATSLALEAKAAGHPEAALLCLEHASEHLPENSDLLIDIGLIAGDLHLYHRAEHAFAAVLARDPHNPRALYAAARVATEAQHLSQAETYLRDYLALKPTDATAHFGLGHVLAMELNTPAAKAEFERSIALQPTQSESFYQLGVLAANIHNDREAETLFRKTLARNPQHGGALTGLGQLSYRNKDYSAAQKSLTAAVAAAPDYQPAHYYLGLTLARLGQPTASASELDKATQLTQQQQAKATPEPGESAAP